MSNARPALLSIVIPTRNRPSYAFSAVLVALDATEHAEIVVVDSSNTDELKVLIDELDLEKQCRVKYHASDTNLNVVENFELALSFSSGEYVIFIGDDDFVGPYIEDFAFYAYNQNIDALICYGLNFGFAYYWPGVKSRYFGDDYAGRVFQWSLSEKMHEVDLYNETIAVQGNVGLGLLEMPRVYQGLVRRGIFHSLIDRYGHVFGGVSPDIYSSVLIASVAQTVKFIDFPFCVPGASPVSEAGSGVARTDRESFSSSPYLQRFKNLEWDDRIPRFFSPYTGWGFSLVKGLETVGEYVPTKTFCLIYARCLLFARKSNVAVYRAMAQLEKTRPKSKIYLITLFCILGEVGRVALKIVRRLTSLRAGGRAKRFGPFPTSWDAYCFLRNSLKRPTILENKSAQ